MRTCLVSILGALLALSSTDRGEAQQPFDPRDSARIVALEHAVEEATRLGDAAFLDRIYAPSFRFKHSTGHLEERAERLSGIRARRHRIFSRDLDSLDVEVHGDVALTTGRIHVRQESGDPRWREYTVRYARVYVLRQGRWLLLTHHSTGETHGPLHPPRPAADAAALAPGLRGTAGPVGPRPTRRTPRERIRS